MLSDGTKVSVQGLEPSCSQQSMVCWINWYAFPGQELTSQGCPATSVRVGFL
jgi:hypothetical protein